MKEVLERAKQKYEISLRNYNYLKDQYEEYYYEEGGADKYSKKEIKEIEFKMNAEFDKMQEILYIFGRENSKYIRGE